MVGENRILNSDLIGGDRVNAVPMRELDGDVIEHDVGRRQQIDPALLVVRIKIALTKTEMADDDILRVVKRNFAAQDGDPAAGRGLAPDGKVVFHTYGGTQIDVTPHSENDDAPALAYCVAERSCAAVGERGDVIDRSCTATRGVGRKAQRAGERGNLRA